MNNFQLPADSQVFGILFFEPYRLGYFTPNFSSKFHSSFFFPSTARRGSLTTTTTEPVEEDVRWFWVAFASLDPFQCQRRRFGPFEIEGRLKFFERARTGQLNEITENAGASP